ncbi:MAG: hypothetical protein WA810_00195, partial [Maribacter sp.]
PSSSSSSTGLTDGQLSAMGQRNGCSDSKAYNANERYNQIMSNPSISSAYKQGYEGGWISCKSNNGTPIKEVKKSPGGPGYILVKIFFEKKE